MSSEPNKIGVFPDDNKLDPPATVEKTASTATPGVQPGKKNKPRLPRSPIGRDMKAKKVAKLETVLTRVLGVGVIEATGLAIKHQTNGPQIVEAYLKGDIEEINRLLAPAKLEKPEEENQESETT